MKTKIHFTINSEEITKQINEALLAEAKNYCRNYAEKAYKNQIKEETTKILTGKVKTELSISIQRAIDFAVRDWLKEYIKNDEQIKKMVLSSLDNYVYKYETATKEYLKKVQTEIDEKIDKKVTEVLKAELLQKLVSIMTKDN